jgi:hypothetical protein
VSTIHYFRVSINSALQAGEFAKAGTISRFNGFQVRRLSARTGEAVETATARGE